MFPNLGYHTHQLTDYELEPVRAEVAAVWDRLAITGPHINHREPLTESVEHLDSIITPLIREFDQAFHWPNQLRVIKRMSCLKLADCWVNFMGPGESTPIHSHGGAVSWTLWLRIPYTRADEVRARPWVPESNNVNGAFAFHYTNHLGQIQTSPLWVDRSWEGRLAIWPAPLSHSVFPYYTSQDVRVSVAGNYWFDV